MRVLAVFVLLGLAPALGAQACPVLFRDGRPPRGDLIRLSGDKRFDESIQSIVRDSLPASPPLPSFPDGASGNSLPVLLTFGEIPTGVASIVRFAAVQSPVELQRRSLRVVAAPAGTRERFPMGTMKYDVRENGTIDFQSIEFLQSIPRTFEDIIRDGLREARFKPATSNCRPIAQTVVQTFGR